MYQVKAQELTNVNEVEFLIHGSGLDKKDFLGKFDPYLVIKKKQGFADKSVYQTEVKAL